jgi:hypothetical protein
VFQIVTGILAIGASVAYVVSLYRRRTKLEQYLKAERAAGGVYQHTTLHLMAKLGMTEEELFRASFRSERVNRLLREDDNGLASHILFEYAPPAN